MPQFGESDEIQNSGERAVRELFHFLFYDIFQRHDCFFALGQFGGNNLQHLDQLVFADIVPKAYCGDLNYRDILSLPDWNTQNFP